ncbi:hypothetical protein J7E73_13445 [Paenibacillus albidus]|uniref:hypothetical protein n=1 Tax=Paenibacillus albidus TaxID=2041023 RepID=UPI001BE75C9E|nr:hypothetical protein [Paenibacillus albidus]MBT2290128.1 hypothetical protein [Paenibacillus albidus]
MKKVKSFKVMKSIQEILRSDSRQDKNVSWNRSKIANLLGVSINVIINWERCRLLEIPRSMNGYRVYGEDERKQQEVRKNETSILIS